MVNILIFAGSIIALLLGIAIGITQMFAAVGFIPLDHKVLAPVNWFVAICQRIDDKLVKITFRGNSPEE